MDDAVHIQSHDATRWLGSSPLPRVGIEEHLGRRTLVYAERRSTFNDLLADVESSAGHRTALRFEDRRWSYTELLTEARLVAENLRARHGVSRGDRVAALTGNIPEFVVFAVASSLLGTLLVPLNTRLTAPELRFMLADSGSRVLLTTPDEFGKIRGHRDGLPELSAIYVADGAAPAGTAGFDELGVPGAGRTSTTGPPGAEAGLGEEDGVYLCYTSGTTGRPKGVVCTHLGLVHTIRNYELVAGLRSDDVTLIALPIFHITGLAAQMATFLALGATVALQRLPLRAGPTLAAIERYSATHLFGVPTAFIMLLGHEAYDRHDLSSLRIVASGGAPLPPDVVRTWAGRHPDTAFLNFYGLTETTSPVSWLPDAMKLERAGSAGVPLPVAEFRVVDVVADEDGGGEAEVADVPAGEVGELAVRGPMVFAGYWRAEEQTRAAFLPGGWFRTGDLVRRDGDGFVHVLDRVKDMINRAGEKVYCAEVENVLHAHPDVLEAAVVGRADDFYGEVVEAVIVPRPGRALDTASLEAHVRVHLADYKCPSAYRYAESLPRNPGGKVLKDVLRRELAEAVTGQEGEGP